MKSIGNILREWRKQNRYSQLQFATELDISSKHVCFIETGRSAPSREMILKIGDFLHIRKREINRGLLSAGYAPTYSELPISHEKLKPVLSAIDLMIMNHMPFPALVFNKNWDVEKANDAAKQLLHEIGYAKYDNLVEALASDDPATSNIINWHETASIVLSRLKYEISTLGESRRLEELLKKLENKLATSIDSNEEVSQKLSHDVIISTQFKLPDSDLSLFSIVADLNTVQDINISELRVELMFPSDQQTKDYYA